MYVWKRAKGRCARAMCQGISFSNGYQGGIENIQASLHIWVSAAIDDTHNMSRNDCHGDMWRSCGSCTFGVRSSLPRRHRGRHLRFCSCSPKTNAPHSGTKSIPTSNHSLPNPPIYLGLCVPELENFLDSHLTTSHTPHGRRSNYPTRAT